MQWYLFDERSGDDIICDHCKKKVTSSKYYILQSELYNERNMVKIGSGCVKKLTGQTIKEIKTATELAMRIRTKSQP